MVVQVAQSCPILPPQGLQHARLPCPSPPPRACSDSCPLSGWWHPTISSSVFSFSARLQVFPASGSSNEWAPRIRWPEYLSFTFSISPSNEYSGLIFISFRIDWFDLLAIQEYPKTSKISFLMFSFFFHCLR